MAGSRWEILVAVGCAVLLGVVSVVEVVTPDVVVGIVGLLPLLAAAWMLSNRGAACVGSIATVLFGLAISVEAPNRLTLILMGLTALLTALFARLYAAAFAFLLTGRRGLRPAVPTLRTPAMLDQIDGFSHGVRSLTRRELDVACLGAQGLTTKEIAHDLGIGARTVESHLGSAYSKLGISSRRDLIRMATRLGIP